MLPCLDVKQLIDSRRWDCAANVKGQTGSVFKDILCSIIFGGNGGIWCPRKHDTYSFPDLKNGCILICLGDSNAYFSNIARRENFKYPR